MSKAKQQQMWEEQRAYFAERACWYAVDEDGNRVAKGDEVKCFRGETYVFDSVTAFPDGGSSGKVLVIDPTVPEGEWCRSREFYPQVFDLKLRRDDSSN